MPASRAYSYLVKLLSARDYSEVKLRTKLNEKKFPANDIEDAINEIKERGYLREDLYNEARIKGLMHKGYSKNYIYQKLSQESDSINMDLIEEVFLDNHLSETDQVKRLVEKKWPKELSSEYEERQKQTQKIVRYALSKGHRPNEVFAQIKSFRADFSAEE